MRSENAQRPPNKGTRSLFSETMFYLILYATFTIHTRFCAVLHEPLIRVAPCCVCIDEMKYFHKEYEVFVRGYVI